MTDTATDLRLERIYDAAPERVFDAWTNREVLRRWWAAGPDWEGVSAEVDLRVGGRLRLAMQDPDADRPYAGGGEYTVVERPGRIAFTWRWEDRDDPETLVTVDFHPHGDGTRLVLAHSGLGSEESRDGHADGWTKCLDNLGSRVLEAA